LSALYGSGAPKLGKLKNSSPLLGLSLMDSGVPLLRIFVITHFLPLQEVGFATLLTAFVTFLELSTDIVIHRFLFSAPRDKFYEAVAAVHALAIARGVLLGVLGLCVAPLVAAALSLSADWGSFAWLAPTLFVRSLQHMGPKIGERDFQYGAQVKSIFAGYAAGLVVLFAVSARTHSHVAVIAAFYGQDLAGVIASHVYAKFPYRFNFRSPLFVQACKFAYPLMFNGIGIAASLQADRFVVAGLFDLKTVAIYSIIMMTVTVPGAVITKIFSTTILARLYHASEVLSRLHQEIMLIASLSAVTAAFYGGGVAFLTNFVVTAAFGQKFHVSRATTAILGLAAFVRFVRAEPFNALMLNLGRTKRLAASNFLVSTSLVYLVVIALFNQSMEAIVLTRLMGETTALIVTIYISRQVLNGGSLVFSRSTITGLGFVCAACLAVIGLPWLSQSLVATLAACVVYTIAIAFWAVWELRAAQNRRAALPADGGKASGEQAPPPDGIEAETTGPAVSGGA
jgi:O-antigen/teichoic acid export membrane protein